MCCYAAVPFGKANIIVPDLRCRHLRVDKATGASNCTVYSTRHETAKHWCTPLPEAIEKGIFPFDCPYVKGMPSYVGSLPLTDDTYDLIKPDLVRALAPKGKPSWASSTSWQKFTQQK